MWTNGRMMVNGIDIHYWVKHYKEPSNTYGIDGGRISKLMLKQNSKIMASYERGWEVKPQSKEAELVFNTLLSKYN